MKASSSTAEVLQKLLCCASDHLDYLFKKQAHKRQINWPLRKFLHCCCFLLLVELSVSFLRGGCKTLRDCLWDLSYFMADYVSNTQIVKEYERAVIFRLGRITDRKPKGPGLSCDHLCISQNPKINDF